MHVLGIVIVIYLDFKVRPDKLRRDLNANRIPVESQLMQQYLPL